jgi:hypothetical protein
MIALDTSMSMSYAGRWERAVGEAESVVDAMSSGDRGQVIASGPGIRLASEAIDNRDELKAAIRSLKPTDSRNSFGETAEAVRSLVPNSDIPVELHLISDFQQSAMPGRFSDLALPTSAELVMHDISGSDSPNWCVESIKGTTRLYGNTKPRLEVTVAGFGTPESERRVNLSINGKNAGSQLAKLPESGRATVVFEGFELPSGFSRAEVTIEPGDDLAADDRRLLALDNSEPAPILFISGDQRRRDVIYYEAALNAAPEAMFKVESASPSDVDRLEPDRFALVVISDVPRLSNLFAGKLDKYVQSGGSVLLAVGPKIVLAGEAPLYSQPIREARYTGREGDRFRTVGNVDLTHPAFSQVERFRGIKFFRYAELEARPTDDVPVRLADNTPIWLEEAHGEGRVMVFGSSLDNIWNDLPVHPVFVPFVLETARYLSGRDEGMRQAVVDSVLELRKHRGSSGSVQVFDPAGERALSLAESVSEDDLPLTQLGFYEVRRSAGTELVAVSADPRESNLRQMDADAMALWKGTGRAGAEAAAAQGEESPLQAPPIRIWRFILLLLLAVALLESVIGNLHLKVQREVEI